MPEERKEQEQQQEQNTTTNPQDGNERTSQDAGKNDTFSREYVEDLRKEAAKYRTKLRELEQQMEQKTKKELEEQQKFKELYEKTQRELEELREQQRLARFNSALLQAAQKAGFRNPDDIRLADLSQVELVDGKLTGIEKVIDELRKNRPYLFTEQGTSDNQTGATGKNKGYSLKDWAKLKPEEREALLKKAAENFKL